jgi:heme a synthase
MALPRISPRAYRRVTFAALLSLAFIIVTGAAVRLTGSGLGCTDWPTCEDGRIHAPMEFHAMVEFGNRLLTGVVSLAVILAVLGSLLRLPRRRDLTWLSLGLVAGVVGQIVLGGIVVLTHVHPAAVQGHFVLSMVILLNALVLQQRAAEPDGVPLEPTVPPALRRLTAALVTATFAVVVTGTVVTGTGPHGGDEEARRFGFDLSMVARIHSLTVLLTLAGVLWLYRQSRRGAARQVLTGPIETVLWVGGAQAAIGWTQYLTGVPVFLVTFHIIGAIAFFWAIVRLHLATRAPRCGPRPGRTARSRPPCRRRSRGRARAELATCVDVASRSSRSVFSVRSARSPGECLRFRNTVSVSSAATMALLPVLVHRRLGAETMRVPICTPRRPARRRRPWSPVDDAAGGDDRHVHLRADERQQHHGGHVARVLEAAALAALDHQPVDAGRRPPSARRRARAPRGTR